MWSKVYLRTCVQLYSLAETPQLSPSSRIWAHMRGRYWSAKINDISVVLPGHSRNPGHGSSLEQPEPRQSSRSSPAT